MELDFLFNTVSDAYSKIRELRLEDEDEEIRYIMHMALAIIRDRPPNYHGPMQEVWIRDVVNISHGLEDCVDRFKMVAIHERHGSSFQWPFHTAKKMMARAQFAGVVKPLKQQLREKVDEAQRWPVPPYLASSASPASSSVPTASYISQGDPLGLFEKRKEDIRHWLQKEKQQHLSKLTVISIVGFLGLGKTTLAKMIYDDDDICKEYLRTESKEEEDYLRIFVVASEFSNGMELLRKIYQEVFNSPLKQDHNQLIQNIRGKLSTERYVMVIDDVQTWETWHSIRTAFPIEDTSGLIIVTTRINSVANMCSSSGGYVYRMQALDKEQSKELLVNGVTDTSGDFAKISESIVNKCDGLPLALVGVAEYLEGSSGKFLLAMKEGLADWYSRLRSTHKTLLLYSSMYPVGCVIRKRSLCRRLLSEGLVSGHDQRHDEEDDHFRQLVDWNLIQPVDISYNGEVKTCRVHGVLHDFIVKKSVDENFVTLIHNDKLVWNGSGTAVRRLSVHKTSDESIRTAMDIDLSCLRTLAMSKHEGGPIVDFRKCELLRVLDLESCPWLDNSVLRVICSLLNLRYLSLRDTAVTKIPKRISKLQCLKMLVIRDEKEGVLLPMEILILPQLTCLLGRFRLYYDRKLVSKIRNLEESRLETLAGIMVDKSPGIEHILNAMRHLKKIKLWAENTSGCLTQILASLCHVEDHNVEDMLSLSIDFGNDRNGLSLQNFDYMLAVASLKLRGTLTGLCNFIPSLCGLHSLCLFSNGLRSEVLLALQTDLPFLLHLKLADDEDCSIFCDGSVQFQAHRFPSLQSLWIETKKLPKISIEEGSMQCLTSLKLLCDDVSGLPADTITRLTNLREVTLGDKVVPKTRKKWEDVAGSHPNRPSIETSLARKSGDKQGKS